VSKNGKNKNRNSVLAALFALSLVIIQASAVSADSGIVGGSPYDVAINPTSNIIYATNRLTNAVSVIDEANDSVIASIAVTGPLTGIAVNPNTGKTYVGSAGEQYLDIDCWCHLFRAERVSATQTPMMLHQQLVPQRPLQPQTTASSH
jgi:YVTN family beta-propeller protein